MKANPTNGRHETYKLTFRRRRKPNPLHTLFGAISMEQLCFSVCKPISTTDRTNHRKAKLTKSRAAENNPQNALTKFHSLLKGKSRIPRVGLPK